MPEVHLESNRLLAVLPAEVRERLRPQLTPVTLELGATLHRPGERLRHVYFPLEAIVSKLHLSADGSTTSIGVIGREGIVELSAFLSGLESSAETQVIGAGAALRIGVPALTLEFERGGAFQRTLLNYTQAFIAQTGQIAVCNRHHPVDRQLCFWLLLYLERTSSNELRITQQLLASLLGVRREGITRAALKLKEAGILDYRHGRIVVRDPARIKALACECYNIVHNIYESMLAPPPPETWERTLTNAVG